MELKQSYIFLNNPFIQKENPSYNEEEKILDFPWVPSVNAYFTDTFPNFVRVDNESNYYQTKYTGTIPLRNVNFSVIIKITNVEDSVYVDVFVKGKTKLQIIQCIEHIQEAFLSSGICDRYIDIVSYDAISEYYCNKIFPDLNILERNLRKLMFNLYIVNFGDNYYKMTIDDKLQSEVKQRSNSGVDGQKRQAIKNKYHLNNNKEAETVHQLQNFFYSFTYEQIQRLLFDKRWTPYDEKELTKFLNSNEDLSLLSDTELRDTFLKFYPQTDWGRFFKSKIDILNIEDLIDEIRVYRNTVSHFKFFYRDDYKNCKDTVNTLNNAIVNAITITEDYDFSNRNKEALKYAIQEVSERYSKFLQTFVEITKKTANIVGESVIGITKNKTNKKLGEFANKYAVEKDEEI